MDHATTEMVDGRGTGLGAKTVRRYDNGPTWDGRKATYDQWWYEMHTYIGTLGLGPTLAGTNRAKFESDDEETKNAYDMLNLKLWRVLYQAVDHQTDAGKALLLEVNRGWRSIGPRRTHGMHVA